MAVIDQQQLDIQAKINDAASNEKIPRLYGNNFFLALGTGDVALLLRNANTDVAVINMSYTTAKSLSLKLADLISFLESKSKNTIMTTAEIEKMFTEEVKK